MQQTSYADPNTTAQITGWAQARYATAAPSLTGYYSPQPTAVATPTATAPPTSWASAASSPAAPGVKPAPASAAAPTIPTAPERPTFAPATTDPVKTATINQADLATRTVDKTTETVQGQMQGLMDENGQYMQQARADALRTANERGMLNSAMAASGGTDAAIRSALPIATADAGTYAGAADYNVALKNQATMWNADQTNQGFRLDAQYADAAKARAQAAQLAQMQDDTSRWQTGAQLQNSQWQTQLQNDTAKWTTEQQLLNSQWERQVSDATSRYTAEMQDATSRYNTDAGYRKNADESRLSMANNIIQNMDMSPDRKAAMLEALGQGTMAKYVNGVYQPGSGLAGAVYVLGSVSSDLDFGGGGGGGAGGGGGGSSWANATGPTGSMVNDTARSAIRAAQAQDNYYNTR